MRDLLDTALDLAAVAATFTAIGCLGAAFILTALMSKEIY